MKDFEGIEIPPNSFLIDCLASISGVALAIFEEEQKIDYKEKEKLSISDKEIVKNKENNRKRIKSNGSYSFDEKPPNPNKQRLISKGLSPRNRGICIREPLMNNGRDQHEENLIIKNAAETESTDNQECQTKKSKKLMGPNLPLDFPMEFREALEELGKGKSSIKELKLIIQKGLYARECGNYRVDIIEPSLKRGKVSLRRWIMKKKIGKESIINILTGKSWNGIVNRNCLVERDIIQVWSARVDEQICFLLVKL
ncbi:hypothetical protein M9H77_14407 [Catharanthus roseus]|uniref:Uncharacterized protein n=1 Tax=Catharanthus roseus TaxID=4058 RepID=A0ACC0BN46_CATRO|nr:hypothetical protein M9H77_14407 [Catharanthus roseus]